MPYREKLRISWIGLSVVLCSAPVLAQQGGGGAQTPDAVTLAGLQTRLAAMQQQLAEQKTQLQALRRQLDEQSGWQPDGRAAGQPSGQPAPAAGRGGVAAGAGPVASDAQLAAQRGAGMIGAGGMHGVGGTGETGGAGGSAGGAAAGGPGPAQGTGGTSVATGAPVGEAPPGEGRPPEVAPLFEQPGVLTPKGRYVLEPSLQFGYSSSNRVALVGYTIIPALLIGLVDIRELKRNTVTATLTGRYGVGPRTEVEMKLPYVYRSDSTVSREILTGTGVDRAFDTSGKALGDIELALRHQFRHGPADQAYYVGGLRFKTRSGRDPFDVVTDCATRCVGPDATGTGLPLQLPTGSGFYALQPSLTWLYPSDPAILFGSVSYLHNFRRSNVTRRVLNGQSEPLGTVAPGGVIGFNFGLGLALNDKAALSLGYDHSSIARTRQNGQPVPGSVRTQLGTLLVGLSYRLSDKRTVNVAVGAGLTRDTPDVQLSVRLPVTF